MDSKFVPKQAEEQIFKLWQDRNLIKTKIEKNKKPFCIILPPPNANGSLHLGHAMYVYEDVMIRYQKMIGKCIHWQAGMDHAGIETQFVFEKELKKQGKSRFDYSRDELFQMIYEFTVKNKGSIKKQFNRLGFLIDWSSEKFPLDKNIINIVSKTFKKLFDAGLIYRGLRLVNYCTRCGTSFSDLEVEYKDRIDPLYYLKYGPFILATTRPETKFGDTAVAVNPKDKRYAKWIGQEIEVDGLIGKFKLKVVADSVVDPQFGTGVVKVTPAHDQTDWEIGQRHNLPMEQVIDYSGRLNEKTGPYKGMRIMEARKKIAEDLKNKGLLIKVNENYQHRVGTCYKCKSIIEPLPKEQWFIKTASLKEQAKELVIKNKIKIYPNRFKKALIDILDNFIDWNISRQIVWGIRIPAYRCEKKNQWFVSLDSPKVCQLCGICQFKQDEDTFDTWFSSSQWPFITLQAHGKDYFDFFYPTSVMETGYDILRAWVARMIMIDFFATGKIPFKDIYLHGLVRDKHGQKMSKSKGNVMDPIGLIDKFGADALRAALVFSTEEGHDVVLSEDKIIGMRNFTNKIWNIGRFFYLISNDQIPRSKQIPNSKNQTEIIKEMGKELEEEKKEYLKLMNNCKFSQALGLVYEFIWHRFADIYIEKLKPELQNGNIKVLELMMKIYLENLKMLHPFVPFVTEAIWQVFHKDNSILENTI